MERIIRLNAVKDTSHSGNSGMKQHSLYPKKTLSPQKLIASVASFILLVVIFQNTQCNSSPSFTEEITNTQWANIFSVPLLMSLLLIAVVEIKLSSHGHNIVAASGIVMLAGQICQLTEACIKSQIFKIEICSNIKYRAVWQKSIKLSILKVWNHMAFYNELVISQNYCPYQILVVLIKKCEVQAKLKPAIIGGCDFIGSRVIFECREMQIWKELAQAYQAELRLEGKK